MPHGVGTLSDDRRRGRGAIEAPVAPLLEGCQGRKGRAASSAGAANGPVLPGLHPLLRIFSRRYRPRRGGVAPVGVDIADRQTAHAAGAWIMNPGSTPTAGTLDTPGGPLTIKALPPSEAIRFSIIVPTYNESKNIEEMVRRLASLLDAPFGNSYEIIVVDDDSPDRTWESAQSLASEYPQLRVMRRRNERGLSTAVVRGWQAARGDVLAVIDADLQHPPEITLALYDEIRAGADMPVGSRHIEGGGVSDWSLIRRVVSRVAQVIGLVILPGVVGRVSDPMSGYFMMRRTALLGVVLNPLGYKILIEVLGRGRFRWISEVPYVFRERVLGASKVTG